VWGGGGGGGGGTTHTHIVPELHNSEFFAREWGLQGRNTV